jgi:hypothetical protein
MTKCVIFSQNLTKRQAHVIASETKQSVGLKQLNLNAFPRELTDCFVPRNDKVHNFFSKLNKTTSSCHCEARSNLLD